MRILEIVGNIKKQKEEITKVNTTIIGCQGNLFHTEVDTHSDNGN